MTLAAIRNGLASTLTACGPWVASEVSGSDYGILETVSGCAVMLAPGRGTNFEAEAGMGSTIHLLNTWDVGGHVYIKYTGNATCLLSQVWQAHDDILATLKKDNTLQGSVGANGAAWLTRMSYDENKAFEAGGEMWADVQFGLTIQEG